MKKDGVILIIMGIMVILLAVFCPLIIAEMHGLAWRSIIGLLGFFSFVLGIYKIIHKN